MQFEVFTVPSGGGEAIEALNTFLASHRVVGVEKHLASAPGTSPVWLFCVEYLSGTASESKTSGTGTSSLAPRVDYRLILNADDFIIFSRLREMRKIVAEKEKIPYYTVFNNEQLSEIVTKRVQTIEGLGSIDGIGTGRIEKYGAAVMEIMQPLKWPAPPAAAAAPQPVNTVRPLAAEEMSDTLF